MRLKQRGRVQFRWQVPFDGHERRVNLAQEVQYFLVLRFVELGKPFRVPALRLPDAGQPHSPTGDGRFDGRMMASECSERSYQKVETFLRA